MALVKDGLWGVVDNSDSVPNVSDSVDKKAKYKSKKNKALATIVIEPSLLYIICEPDDPVTVWQKLADQFQKKTWANKLVLRRNLQLLKLKDGGSVQQHINGMTETFNELSVMGVVMDNEDRAVQLLASLPESYSTIVMAQEANKKVPIVTERLLHEERKLNEHDSSSNDGAFSMRHKKSIRCHHCQKLGHYQRNCPERGHGRNKQKSYEPRHEHKPVAKAKGPDERAGKHAAHSTQTRHSSDSESECDMVGLMVQPHISNNRSLFVEYKSLEESQSVTLGDGHTLEGVGKGVVALKLELEGGKTITGDVLYVPELAYNLWSISKVTKLGKRVDFYKSHCNIIDDNK
uniref:CCHC-type domain-containing protein n=1 Tax=Amphimedon queenslandica TaxID=400682 RepID=A0A1X7UD16_AMPQE